MTEWFLKMWPYLLIGASVGWASKSVLRTTICILLVLVAINLGIKS